VRIQCLHPFLEKIFAQIIKNGLKTEGIFRIPAPKSRVEELKGILDSGEELDFTKIQSPLELAGLVTTYLRELPEPLLTFELYPHFVQGGGIEKGPSRIQNLQLMVQNLPEANRKIVQQVISFLREIAKYSDINKMTVANLALVFGPNMLRPKEETLQTVIDMPKVTSCIQSLSENYEQIFEDKTVNDSEVNKTQGQQEERVKINRYATALYDWQGNGIDEISFTAGETIFVTKTEGNGWCLGVKNGKIGLFPYSYVQVLEGEAGLVDPADVDSATYMQQLKDQKN